MSAHDHFVPPGLFTLGTVQLGQPYGLGSARMGMDSQFAESILDAAVTAGIAWLDTAQGYGESESRIGQWCVRHGARVRVVSKLRPLASVPDDEIAVTVRRAVDESRHRLRIEKIDAYLTRAVDLTRGSVATALRRAQETGRIGRFGASVYTQEEVEAVLAVPGIGVAQIPLSVVSRSIMKQSVIAAAADRGVMVFARSVFLQGALLLAPSDLPVHLASLAPIVGKLRTLALECRVPLSALLIAAVRNTPGVYSPVLGVDSPDQLSELAAAAQVNVTSEAIEAAIRIGLNTPADIVDPRNWPQA